MNNYFKASDILDKAIGTDAYFPIKSILLGTKTADVAPVRHGRWIPEIRHTYVPVKYDERGEPVLHEYTSYRCSLCGREEAEMEPYCHCGALMDGEEDEHGRM